MKKYLFFLLSLSFSTHVFSQTVPPNTRLIQPTETQGNFSRGFVKHLNSFKDDMFYTSFVNANSDYFGTNIATNSRIVTRIGFDGLPKWNAKFSEEAGKSQLNYSAGDFACVDKNDNFLFLADTSGAISTFTDAEGNSVNFQQSAFRSSKVIIKLDKNGKLLWSKQAIPSNSAIFEAAITTDSKGDVYFVGKTSGTTFQMDNVNIGNGGIFIIKLNGNTGNVIYSKQYSMLAYAAIPIVDGDNNLFIFTDSLVYPSTQTDYNFDGYLIPKSIIDADFLMIKFDPAGNVIFGKNFNASNVEQSYCFPNDVAFDGTDIIVMGSFEDYGSLSYFTGMDGIMIQKKYSEKQRAGFFAKVGLNGNVSFQKAIFTENDTTNAFYTNIDFDGNKNVYGYFSFIGKVSSNNSEYTFDSTQGNKVISKFDTNGNLVYFNPVDIGYHPWPGAQKSIIDVIGDNKINVVSITTQNNFLNYPITNTISPKQYIASFGDLDSKYLIPQKNYLTLSSAEIANNPNNANSFFFNLVNNVNWTATSDQNWLTLSYEKLTQKNAPSNTISDNGDARITINAETNNTGSHRTANVLLSGDSGVASKTIAVTQSGLLATGENKTFVTTLYPNPTSNILNIETKQIISKIEIFDLSGKLVKSENGKDKKVSVSNLTKGMYLIKLYTENGVVNSKFIKK